MAAFCRGKITQNYIVRLGKHRLNKKNKRQTISFYDAIVIKRHNPTLPSIKNNLMWNTGPRNKKRNFPFSHIKKQKQKAKSQNKDIFVRSKL